MTRLLSDVLHERADSAPGPHVDLDAIIGDGDRRVRRSRLSTGLAAAAVAAVIAGGSFVLPDLVAQDQDTPVAGSTPPFAERRAGYALGGVIHWGDQTFEVDMPVTSYLQTDDGFVLTNRKGDVFLFDGTDSRRVGFTSNNRLRTDDTGSLVAWVDRAEDGHPQYVVYDTGALREVARVDDIAAGPSLEPSDQGAEVFALDDGAAYWRNGVDGLVRYDLASGDTTVLASHEPPADPSEKEPVAYAIEDVADGRIAYLVDAGQGASMKVADEIDLRAPTLANASNGVLSPDGRYLGVEEDDNIAVYDTTTGGDVTPSLPGYPFAVVTGWVDDDTAMVFAIKDLDAEPYAFDLLTCDVPTGACDVVTQGDVPTDSETFVIPVGDPMT